MEWKKRLLKHSIAAVIIIVIGILIEYYGFNKNAVNSKTYTETYTKKTEATPGFAVRKSGNHRAAVLVFDEKYINKMHIEFNTDYDFNYKIEMSVVNKFDKEYIDEIQDRCHSELSMTNINVGKRSQKIKIIYPTDVDIKSITIENERQMNYLRMMFVIFALGLVYTFFTCKRLVGENIEYGFLMTALFLGSIMVIALPENTKSWDEQIHFNRAYMYSFHDTVIYNPAAWRIKTLDIPQVDTIEDKIQVRKHLNEEAKSDVVVKELDKDSNFITYAGRAYALQALALWMARNYNWDFTTGLLLARYLNLIQYILFYFLAIKYAKYGKRILTILGLLPTSLFLAASFSYDAYVTALVTFGFVMVVNEFTSKDELINWKRILFAVLGIVVGSFAKAVYVPLVLFLCFLPKEKFVNARQKILFKVSIIIVFLVMMSTFVLPAITNATSGVDTGGDERGGDTSVTRQLNSILDHPVEYAELFTETVITTAPSYFLGYQSRTFFAYLDGDSGPIFYLCLILTVFVAFTEGSMENHLPLSRKSKLALTAVLVCVIGLVWTALYLDFTPVGLNCINGVQPRYYIPLMFPAVLLIENGRVRCHRVSGFRYNQIVLYGSAIVLGAMIYQYIMVPCCF